MQTHNSIESLLNQIKKDMRPSLRQVGERIRTELRQYVLENWYNSRPTTEFYDRTMQLINSITVSQIIETGNTMNIQVYFDSSKIIATVTEDGKWNQHASIHGEDVSESIPYYIEEGNKSPLYSYDGIHSVENIIELCRQSNIPLQEMITYLSSKGYSVGIK